MDFLQKDLKNLFSGKGIDKSQYDDKVNFMDPITKYNSVTGEPSVGSMPCLFPLVLNYYTLFPLSFLLLLLNWNRNT